MRRLRNDLPYTFRPPKVKSWVRPLGLKVNQAIHLARKYRIAKIQSDGFDQVRELHEAGHAILLAPNHSDHSDPHVIMEICSRYQMQPFFMAAREIFEASPTASWALQNMGVFSVDRDGPDLSAIKTAISLLEKAAEPLHLAEGRCKITGRKERLPRARRAAIFPPLSGRKHLPRKTLCSGRPHRMDTQAAHACG
jgi:1-acyl-sn-glycerol-3-phosphate acyltransferase